jgi:hypothetical protein
VPTTDSCTAASSKPFRRIGDLCPATYVPVEEPSAASEPVIARRRHDANGPSVTRLSAMGRFSCGTEWNRRRTTRPIRKGSLGDR